MAAKKTTKRASTHAALDRALAKQGLRSAGMDEPGWYVTVTVNGKRLTTWATDLPRPRKRRS